ncbi:hypothetical protein PTTG_28471 [Puccinia triticina 1-1 BBBD Race 1]|uniref:Uncharacterized protein n=1 Tax=Puccinia triticina (isolate 1-1 / race 1 (BBBD)) TaxID=630390 RepID=A0A180GBC4_PUCT1|nr:hypothetical protein PTTG_28471 [Puccinia triticina 1-1 BBBD Race 1]
MSNGYGPKETKSGSQAKEPCCCPSRTQGLPSGSNNPVVPVTVKPKVKKVLPTADPFKSKESVSKLIDRDVTSLLHQIKIKKVIPKTNLAVEEPKISTTKAKPSASSSSKKLVFNDGSFDPKTKEKLENYFVPRGRTVVLNYSTTSPLIPSSEDSRESYQPADSSDIDVITGATAQLCWKPKISPGPQGADTLKNFNPRIHPILQGMKNQLDGWSKSSSGEGQQRHDDTLSVNRKELPPDNLRTDKLEPVLVDLWGLGRSEGVRGVSVRPEAQEVPEGERRGTNPDPRSRIDDRLEPNAPFSSYRTTSSSQPRESSILNPSSVLLPTNGNRSDTIDAEGSALSGGCLNAPAHVPLLGGSPSTERTTEIKPEPSKSTIERQSKA